MLRQTDLELKVILLLFPAITGFAKRLRQLKAKMNSRGNAFRSFVFPPLQLKDIRNVLNAANSSVFRFLFLASQVSDTGSIPVARSRNPGSIHGRGSCGCV